MSTPKLLLRILLFRHGRTKYLGNGSFPDLTPEGIAQADEMTQTRIIPWLSKHEVRLENLLFLTSPAPRAHGTAWMVAREIGYLHPHRLQFPDGLAPMFWRDPVKAQEMLLPFRGRSYVDYETELAFQDADVFETPGEVRARWYAFFADLIRQRIRSPNSRFQNVFISSHYEVLCNVTHDLFGIVASAHTALQHTEPIMLTISEGSYRDEVYITGEFRGRHTDVAIFNLRTEKLIYCA